MENLYLIQSSAALAGCSLDMAECRLLLEKGISSAGKTIKEQMLCMDLERAYSKCAELAAAREYWSPYRLKSLAVTALRSCGVDGNATRDERTLQKACSIANDVRLHLRSIPVQQVHLAAYKIHFLISAGEPWEDGNDIMARLFMNYLQLECGVSPTVIPPSGRAEYGRVLGIARREDISEVFTTYMMQHRDDPPEEETPPGPAAQERPATHPEKAAETPAKGVGAAYAGSAGKASSRQKILQLLAAHPHMTTADLSREIGISAKGVEKQIGILKSARLLQRIGPDKGGKWQVNLFDSDN